MQEFRSEINTVAFGVHYQMSIRASICSYDYAIIAWPGDMMCTCCRVCNRHTQYLCNACINKRHPRHSWTSHRFVLARINPWVAYFMRTVPENLPGDILETHHLFRLCRYVECKLNVSLSKPREIQDVSCYAYSKSATGSLISAYRMFYI